MSTLFWIFPLFRQHAKSSPSIYIHHTLQYQSYHIVQLAAVVVNYHHFQIPGNIWLLLISWKSVFGFWGRACAFRSFLPCWWVVLREASLIQLLAHLQQASSSTSLEEASIFGAGSLERRPDYEVVLLKHIMTKEIKNPVRKAQQSAYKGNLKIPKSLHFCFKDICSFASELQHINKMIFALCANFHSAAKLFSNVIQ